MSRVALSDVARRVLVAVRQVGRTEPSNDASVEAVKRATGLLDCDLEAAAFELYNADLVAAGQVGCIGLNADGIELADRLSRALPSGQQTVVFVAGTGNVVQTVVDSPGSSVVAAGRDASAHVTCTPR